MRLYMETTDGSTIEIKESSIVWNYQCADPDFGFCQAKELLDHLESVLANEPVSVKSGQHIVEVKPQVFPIFLFPKHRCLSKSRCSIKANRISIEIFWLTLISSVYSWSSPHNQVI